MILERGDGHQLAYAHNQGSGPGVLFLSGFNSNMGGDKALFLEQQCAAEGRQFTRFDYFGHGQSSGAFEEGTIGRWIDDALAVLDELTSGPQVLVGSSMGGWLMLHLALARPERVAGLLGIAAATDFTEALRDQRLSPEQRLQLEFSGFCEIDNCYDDGEPYRIAAALLDDGRQHCLLGRSGIAIDCPVRLVHGQQDADVPWQHSLALAAELHSDNVEVQLVKDGDHRLSEPRHLARLARTLATLLAELEP